LAIVQYLTTISDASREEIAKKIDYLKAEGYTCLGAGLKQGMDVRLLYQIINIILLHSSLLIEIVLNASKI
jgi:hypothetical protein